MQSFFAAQVKLKEEKHLEKVPCKRNDNYKPSGTRSYVYLLNRFGFEPTKPGPYCQEEKAEEGSPASKRRVLVKKLADGKTGQVTAEDQQYDSMYLCATQIGTPAQTLMLNFDTGSADLWVFSTELPASAQKGHTIFDPSKSSTWKDLPGLTWDITYADKSGASGNAGTDTVGLGGLQVEGQCVELANKMTESFIRSTGDGLLGLAWSGINTVAKNGTPDPQPTVVENMIAQKDIPQAAELFTSAFYSFRDKGVDSFFTFGWIDQDLVKASGEEIYWTPVNNKQGFWMVDSASAVVNGKTIPLSRNTAIVDTGTTLALLSDTVVDAFYAAIPGAKYDSTEQGYVFPIDTPVDKLPDFSVAIGDKQFVIQKDDYGFAPIDSTGKLWYGGIQSRGSNPFDILGDTFLKSIYAIWDQGNVRFGAVRKIP